VRFSLDAELARPMMVEPGWQRKLFERTLQLLKASLSRQKSASSSNLKSKLFAEGLAPLKLLEEGFENAHNNCVDADAFFFGPLFEGNACFRANVQQLRIRQRQASLPGLLDLDIVLVDVGESEENNPSKVSLHAGLLGHCLSQVDGKAESQAGLFVDLDLLLCFTGVAALLHCHFRNFPMLRRLGAQQSALYIPQVYQQALGRIGKNRDHGPFYPLGRQHGTNSEPENTPNEK
jgi:hypothetical protein